MNLRKTPTNNYEQTARIVILPDHPKSSHPPFSRGGTRPVKFPPRRTPQSGDLKGREGIFAGILKASKSNLLVRSFFLLAALMLCTGCLNVPETPLLPGAPEDLERCVALFPSGPWVSIHKIEAVINGGLSSSLVGITKGDPAGRDLHTVLLTPEGFILFEAEEHENTISVLKAVAPFDTPAFAKGLMEDVNLLFLRPEGGASKWGRTADGAVLCEWKRPAGYREDISLSATVKISLLDGHGDLIKEALLTGPFVKGLASRMELNAHKPAPYKLKMTLLQGTQ
jgi:hypothetical protein